MNWLKRSFVAGFFVIVPLFISAAAVLFFFRIMVNFCHLKVLEIYFHQQVVVVVVIVAMK